MVPVRSVTVLVWSNHLARKVFGPELGRLNRSFFFPLSSSLSVGSPPCAGKAPPLAVLNLQNPHPRTLETPPLVILLEKTLPLPSLGERILRKRKSYRERRGEGRGERERGGACIVTRNNT